MITSHREPRSMVPRKASAKQKKLSSCISIVPAVMCIRLTAASHAHPPSRLVPRKPTTGISLYSYPTIPMRAQQGTILTRFSRTNRPQTSSQGHCLLSLRTTSSTPCARQFVPNFSSSSPSRSRPSSRSAQRR